MIIQHFKSPSEYNPPTLWAYMGYIYGSCARKLHYANKYGEMGFTEQEMKVMSLGKAKHSEIQNYMANRFPEMDFRSEYKRIRKIPEIFGIEQVGTKLDLYSDNLVDSLPPHPLAIEIKFMYSKKAYYQIAIEKFVFPESQFRVFQYAAFESDIPEFKNQTMLNVKADLAMSTIYVARIITALNFKPPRFPNAKYSHPTCRNCIYRERCYSETDNVTWANFKSASQYAIDRLNNNSLPAVANLSNNSK